MENAKRTEDKEWKQMKRNKRKNWIKEGKVKRRKARPLVATAASAQSEASVAEDF